ncbi:hypothetical protein LJC29_07905, partial [Bacteroides sp. OttesenSCG-928-N06]|nr:hypothetical protein [Bacteroides sp. OttesenSCG-928-N06]
TFDFPIYKEDAIVKKEQDSILALFQPYYVLNTNTAKESIAKLRNDYNSQLRHILPSTNYVRHIERSLEDIYKSGVISSEDINRLHADSATAILVVENKDASKRFTDGIFTIKEAYEYILSADTANYRKDILRQASLNEYIYPNLIYDKERTEVARAELFDNYSWATGMVQSGQKIIDRGEIVNQQTYNILESLRWINEQLSKGITTITGYIADQSPRKRDSRHFLNFLNHRAPVMIGAEKITKRYNMEAYYLDVVRVKRGHYKATFTRMTDNPSSLPDIELTEIYYTYLEKTIRRHPEYYLWSHNRFRNAEIL